MSSVLPREENQPLSAIHEWEEDVLRRYPETDYTPHEKKKEAFRNYETPERSTVREFYRLNHMYQTVEFVLQKKQEFVPGKLRQMGIWEAMEYLNTLVDDSDPDTSLTQIQHLLQTSEAIRKDGHPRWFVLTGLVHDLGKILCLRGEPQWAVVGDTFPVGCAYSDKIVYPEFFALNPDTDEPEYQTLHGIYEPHCGLDNVHLSWGHDEYMYRVAKDYLPEEGLYMLRYHSFYAAHRERAYDHLMNEHDQEMFRWVRAFNPYDLYSKSDEPPNVEQLQPYYEDLIAEFFPDKIAW
ncbi:MAG: inositol oxygenase [Candidatus Hydrogenedentes bacterium]|nr:inositol oxygenase [Candidatus Hydrogenedentota bacterium]